MQDIRNWITLVEQNQVSDKFLVEAVDVKSADFRSWFGGSKVTDPSGNPLLCYHSSTAEMQGGFHSLTHFGTLRAAEDRSMTATSWSKKKNRYGGYNATSWGFHDNTTIFPVYLCIRRPFRYTDTEGEEAYIDVAASMMRQGLITNQQYDHLLFKDHDPEGTVVRVLKSRGYDGLVYNNKGEDKGSTSWVITHPSQVWSLYSVKPDA